MVTVWRRAFCTTARKDGEPKSRTTSTTDEQQKQQQHCSSNQNSPRIGSKLGFFSNPSTPRFLSHSWQHPFSSLRCKTAATTATNTASTTPASSVPNSPKLEMRTPIAAKSKSPRLFGFSSINNNINNQQQVATPPSTLSLIKSTLRLSKINSSSNNRCGICLQSVKMGNGTATFTAECTHVFHFPCIASHAARQNILVCPVCSTPWSELPLLDFDFQQPPPPPPPPPPQVFKTEDTTNNYNKNVKKSKTLRVYNDDEPLMSPSPGCLFVPIPELEENEVLEAAVNANGKRVEASLLPESAVVSVGRGYETHVAVLRVRAVPCAAAARRPPVDVVAVVDVSERVSRVSRVIKVVVSLLNSNDRLSIVAFNSSSKRLFPLRRMTADGRRLARRMVDSIGSGKGYGNGFNNSNGDGLMSVSDALKKAAKVIEDRVDKNPLPTIIVLSNHAGHQHTTPMEIPTHFFHLGSRLHSLSEDSLSNCFRALFTVAVQQLNLQISLVSDSAPAEITAVYSLNGRPNVFKPNSVGLGNLHPKEERDLLIEFKVPTQCIRSQRGLAIRSISKDFSSQEMVVSEETRLLLPRAIPVKSSNSIIQQLRSCHVSTRAVAESQRLMERRDLSGAYHLLSSARALLMQSPSSSDHYIKRLEFELTELHRRRELMSRERLFAPHDRSPAPLTPTSAWRAAERLAKLAIMRKHINRVSDLHGFENARF